MEAPAPGTPQPRDEWYDSGDDLEPAMPPRARTPLDDTLDSHPLDSDSDRDVSHIAHDTSSEDDRDDRPPSTTSTAWRTTGSSTSTAPVGICAEPRTSVGQRARDRPTRPSGPPRRRLPRALRGATPRHPTAPPPTSQRTNPPVRRGWWRCGGAYAGVGDRPRGCWPWRPRSWAYPRVRSSGCRRRGPEVGGADAGRLGDRDVGTTLRRTWHALSAWERVRFVWAMIAGVLTCQTATSCGE